MGNPEATPKWGKQDRQIIKDKYLEDLLRIRLKLRLQLEEIDREIQAHRTRAIATKKDAVESDRNE